MLPFLVAERLRALALLLLVAGLVVHMLVRPKSAAAVSWSAGSIIAVVGVVVLAGSIAYGAMVTVPCEVVLYSMRGCPHCTTAKDSLAERGIKYTEKEYVRGEGEPPMMPDGTQASMFPTIWVNGENLGSGASIARWAGSCSTTN